MDLLGLVPFVLHFDSTFTHFSLVYFLALLFILFYLFVFKDCIFQECGAGTQPRDQESHALPTEPARRSLPCLLNGDFVLIFFPPLLIAHPPDRLEVCT